jgi:hypothetical protein
MTRKNKIAAPETAPAANPLPARLDELALREEIRDLRKLIDDVRSSTDGGRQSELLPLLDSLGRAYTQLAGLLKAEQSLKQNLDIALAIQQAAARLLKEKGAI